MFSIVGKRFSPAEFASCVAMLDLERVQFTPDMVVLHNTAVPSLAQRPDGFTEAHMRSLRGYYAGMGWMGGPHLFVDDHGIWVFNPLDRRGTHSPSWNGRAWGVEMLGDYDKEPFDTGRGAKVWAHAAFAISRLLSKIGAPVDAAHIRLHKEDPATDHDCPGKNVDKAQFVQSVYMAHCKTADGVKPIKVVFYRKGQGHEPAGVLEGEVRPDGKAYAHPQQMSVTTGIRNQDGNDFVRVSDFLHGKYSLSYDPVERKVYAVEL